MKENGFTLIELSIVLVIIGLIIGGVLVGQDLVSSAATRATLAQIEKYNSAVNTFRNKYNALPGDMLSTQATAFGFSAGSGAAGQGDGNGMLDGCSSVTITGIDCGEAAMFWVHLSSANMIDGTFNSAAWGSGPSNPPATSYQQYFPTAKVGNGNYIFAYDYNGNNWFGLSGMSSIWSAGNYVAASKLTVSQAYNMDAKIDDGIATTGNVLAQYPDDVGPPGVLQAPNGSPGTWTCYNSTTGAYTTAVNNGSYTTCGISFKMQGAAR